MRLFYVSRSSTGPLQFSKNATVVTAVFASIVRKFFLTYNFKNNGGRILLSLKCSSFKIKKMGQFIEIERV